MHMLMIANNGCGLLPLPILANRTNDVPIKLSVCFRSDEEPNSQYSMLTHLSWNMMTSQLIMPCSILKSVIAQLY